MVKKIIGLLSFTFIFGLVGCATKKYYDVKGVTLEEIKKSMDEQKIIHAKGRNAYARWRIHFSYSEKRVDDKCIVGDINVRMTSTTMMPRLLTLEKLSPELQKQWNIYLKNQLKHLMALKEFGLQAKKEVKEKLKNMKKVNCDKFTQKADNLGNSIIQKHFNSSEVYDRKTNYGVKNGASFP